VESKLASFVLSAAALRTRRATKWRGFGDDVLPASMADMDFAVAEPVQRAIARVVRRVDYGYPLRIGESRVEAAFAARMRERFGWALDPDHVVIVDNLLQAYVACLVAFTDPGDSVAVQTPAFFPFLDATAATLRRSVHAPLVDDGNRFVVDEDVLGAAIDQRTRILLVCNPHNPSGRVLERAELEAMGRLAIDRDLVIVSDEVHCDLVYAGARHLPMASISQEIASRTITINSATKGFNISGLRCGVMHFGCAELRDRFRRAVPPHLLGSVNVIGLDATVAAWREGQPWLDEVMELLAANRARVARWAAEESVGHHPPEATYLAWLDCRALPLEGPPADFFLREARVGLLDGAPFGPVGEGHVRLNFATSETILEEILDRLSRALSTMLR
jgi:cysteine-S-conjugate beta-lyase